MTNNEFDAIEEQLPWGFHDALLIKLQIEWTSAQALLDLRVPMTESQGEDRLGQLTFNDLVFCTLEAPELDTNRGYVAATADGLQVDCGQGIGRESLRSSLPSTPADHFVLWFFVREWNRFIHICARSVRLTWLEDGNRPRSSRRRALFPGDDI